MKITGVKIRKFVDDPKLVAIASITIEESFAVHDIKVIRDNERFFLEMPKRAKKGVWPPTQDVAHPINQETRSLIEEAVMSEFFQTKIITKDNTITRK